VNRSASSRIPAGLDAILMDLDGTLVDSAAGILGSLRAAFAEAGVPEPGTGLGWELLGPPLYATLPPLVGSAAADAIVTAYRTIYVERGWLLSTPYDGVDAMLRDLAGDGLRIAVATSKQEAAARLIVDKQGWTDLITTVCGDTPAAERPTKADVVAEALARLRSPSALMVGDRSYDVLGAAAHGIGCIGAGWGYAQPGELLEAGALAVCDTPADLVALLRR
jgi:phosphoglycolate phosphatase